jgi:PAS domain S-box-containing protein
MFGLVTAERLTAFFYGDHRRREANGNISDGEPVVLAWFPNQAVSVCTTEKRSRIFRTTTEVSKDVPKRKPYTPPSYIRYESEEEYPDWTRGIVRSLRQELGTLQFEVEPQYVTVVDSDRKYVEVSDSFCQLVGYQREELIGKRYDDLTAPNTNDIPTVFGLFQKLGYMHGMWMLVSREGTRILVRYESWLRPDSYIEGHMEVVGAGY